MFDIEQLPFILYFKENKIYRYEGSLKLNDLLHYLSADNFKEALVFHEDLQEFAD